MKPFTDWGKLQEQHLQENTDVLILYHGTSTKNAEQIRREGLKDRRDVYDAQWFMFATDQESAIYHASHDEDRGLLPALITFEIPKGDGFWDGYPYLWEAEDFGNGRKWYAPMKEIPAQFIKGIEEVPVDRFKDIKTKGFV